MKAKFVVVCVLCYLVILAVPALIWDLSWVYGILCFALIGPLIGGALSSRASPATRQASLSLAIALVIAWLCEFIIEHI